MSMHRVIVRVKAQDTILRANITTTPTGAVHLTGDGPNEREVEITTNSLGLLSFAFGIQTQAPDTTWTLTLIEKGASRPRYQHTGVTSAAAIGSDQGNVRFE